MEYNKTLTPELQKEFMQSLVDRGLTCATAESCTGGLIAAYITDISGASQVFLGGAVTYSNLMKQQLLGVSSKTLEHFSAVSTQTAAEMAAGIRSRTSADIAVSVTGNAGPMPSEGKPVGMVFVGVDSQWHSTVQQLDLCGSRDDIRLKVVAAALTLIIITAQQKP